MTTRRVSCFSNHESAYRAQVEAWACTENLFQAYVAGAGHCAFTSKQVLAALAAMENWLDAGIKPDASLLPEAAGFDNQFVPPQWPFTPWPF